LSRCQPETSLLTTRQAEAYRTLSISDIMKCTKNGNVAEQLSPLQTSRFDPPSRRFIQ
jgi:hypothetical protein